MSEFHGATCWARRRRRRDRRRRRAPMPRQRDSRRSGRRRRCSPAPNCRHSASSSARSTPKIVGRRLGQGSDGRGISGLGKARGRADVARPGRAARAALARQCGGMGLRDQGPMPRHHHQSRRASRRSPTSPPATSGISRAGSATRSRASAARIACSCSCSTTAISPSSAPSASATGSGTRRPRCWRRISACRRRPSPNFPRREVYIAKGPVPPPLPADPAPGALNAGALTHRYRLLAQRPEPIPAARNRLVSQREFPDLRDHDRRAHAHQAGRLARDCIGIPTPTSGSTISAAAPA